MPGWARNRRNSRRGPSNVCYPKRLARENCIKRRNIRCVQCSPSFLTHVTLTPTQQEATVTCAQQEVERTRSMLHASDATANKFNFYLYSSFNFPTVNNILIHSFNLYISNSFHLYFKKLWSEDSLLKIYYGQDSFVHISAKS